MITMFDTRYEGYWTEFSWQPFLAYYIIGMDCSTDWNHTIDPVFQTTT